MKSKLSVIVGLILLGWVSLYILSFNLTGEAKKTLNLSLAVAGAIALYVRWPRANGTWRLAHTGIFAVAIVLIGTWLTYMPESHCPSAPITWVKKISSWKGWSMEKVDKTLFVSACATLLLSINLTVDLIIGTVKGLTVSPFRMVTAQWMIYLALAWQIVNICVIPYEERDALTKEVGADMLKLHKELDVQTVEKNKVVKAIPVATPSKDAKGHKNSKSVRLKKTPKDTKAPKWSYVSANFDVRKGLEVTAEDLNKTLGGVLKGKGKCFVESGKKNGVNPVFLAGISTHESGNGTSSASYEHNNPMGVMQGKNHRDFDSVEEAIEYTAHLLGSSDLYVRAGNNTVAEIQKVYCPVGAKNDPKKLNKYWLTGVVDWMNKIYAKAEKSEQDMSHAVAVK